MFTEQLLPMKRQRFGRFGSSSEFSFTLLLHDGLRARPVGRVVTLIT